MARLTKSVRILGSLITLHYVTALQSSISRFSNFDSRDIATKLHSQLSSGARIYTSHSLNWEVESVRWSAYKQPTWNYVIVPRTENDVSVITTFATSHNISFMAQGGGHGYSPTLATIRDAIMIRLDNFVYTSIDKRSQTVKVGGGTTFGPLIAALQAASQVLPVGVSPCVGATGATLGGGHGRLQGLLGLMIDSVQSFRVVLADGRIVTASQNSHSNLFYALKGAGQNFGIVLETIFKTHDDPTPDGLYYTVDMTFNAKQLESVLMVINRIIPGQPGELALILLISAGDPSPPATITVTVNLVWAGTRERGSEYAQMFNEILPSTYKESMISFGDLPAKSVGGIFTYACAKGTIHNNYSANMKYFNLTTMRTSIHAYVDFMAKNSGTNGSAWLIEIFGQAAVNAIPSSSAAYPNRGFDNILPIIQGVFTPGDTKADIASDRYLKTVRDLVAETSGYGKLHIYQNYAHGEEHLGSIYGYDEKKFLNLQCLKEKYDPGNVFRGYHDVPLPKRGVCKKG